jgi:hypothetical protein
LFKEVKNLKQKYPLLEMAKSIDLAPKTLEKVVKFITEIENLSFTDKPNYNKLIVLLHV